MTTPNPVRVFCVKAPAGNQYIKVGKVYYLRFYDNSYRVHQSEKGRLCLLTVYKNTQNDRVNYLFYEAAPDRRLFELL